MKSYCTCLVYLKINEIFLMTAFSLIPLVIHQLLLKDKISWGFVFFFNFFCLLDRELSFAGILKMTFISLFFNTELIVCTEHTPSLASRFIGKVCAKLSNFVYIFGILQFSPKLFKHLRFSSSNLENSLRCFFVCLFWK